MNFTFIAKLHAYGFNKESILDYLSNRQQRPRICDNFGSWDELLQGVPQVSVLGPLLFNIHLSDLFYLTEFNDVYNFADDTTFFACDSDLKHLMERLKHNAKLAIEQFENFYMKLNKDKRHVFVAELEVLWAKTRETKIQRSKNKKLLGLSVDRNLNFDDHVFTSCKKNSQKNLRFVQNLKKFF